MNFRRAILFCIILLILFAAFSKDKEENKTVDSSKIVESIIIDDKGKEELSLISDKLKEANKELDGLELDELRIIVDRTSSKLDVMNNKLEVNKESLIYMFLEIKNELHAIKEYLDRNNELNPNEDMVINKRILHEDPVSL